MTDESRSGPERAPALRPVLQPGPFNDSPGSFVPESTSAALVATILKHERRVSSYKLALLRSLAANLVRGLGLMPTFADQESAPAARPTRKGGRAVVGEQASPLLTGTCGTRCMCPDGVTILIWAVTGSLQRQRV
jgi:hypothetical protein